MFSTIWMWTQEWSDMCRRSAFRPCIRHHAFTWSSPLTAASSSLEPPVAARRRLDVDAARSPRGRLRSRWPVRARLGGRARRGRASARDARCGAPGPWASWRSQRAVGAAGPRRSRRRPSSARARRGCRRAAPGPRPAPTSSTRVSRLRGMRSADPIQTSGPRRCARRRRSRECSRKRPTIDTTRMFSDTPSTPGRRQQIPRMLRSTCTPACEARYSALMHARSTSEFIFSAMRDGCSGEWASIVALDLGRGSRRAGSSARRAPCGSGAAARSR